MCGFAGFLGNELNKNLSLDILKNMASKINHRGPDDDGYYVLEEKGVAFAHKRLSIIDLSKQGSQPMISNSGRYVIVFNGEIYNYVELRKKYLNGKYNLLGNSDTEVLLGLIETYGLKKAISFCYGMFAFALYDYKNNKLFLIRDRIGEKPLYYGWAKKNFIFASEIKALKEHPQWSNNINQLAIKNFVEYNYIPTPLSIYENIYKLEPNTILTISLNNILSIEKKEKIDKNLLTQNINHTNNYNDLLDLTNETLNQVVKEQSRADVEVGCFLSGGVDSSLVASIMQSNKSNKIKTFTVGYKEDLYNESIDADNIAKFLGTDHNNLIVSYSDALDIIPKLSDIYDEPFADASQIPTTLISKYTKNFVKVTLSGDGGDEFFGGYNRYIWASNYYSKINIYPLKIRKLLKKILLSFSPNFYNQSNNLIEKLIRKKFNIDNVGEKINKIASVLDLDNEKDVFYKLISHWEKNPSLLSNDNLELKNNIQEIWDSEFETADNMMNIDKLTYLPDDILVKVDRASMYYSLETRVPFLDKRIIELSNSISLENKIRNNKGKIILKDVLKKYLPEKYLKQTKKGFSAPISTWLRGPLKDWGYSLLNKSDINSQGYFNYDLIKKKWDQHQSSNYNNQYELWSILMFQSWLNRNK